MSNIIKSIPFNTEKPAVFAIRKTDSINYIAVGLLQDQVLPEHKTGVPTLLTVLSGSIEFSIGEEKYLFNEFDTYQIPVNEIHHVRGLKKTNAFTLILEKK